MSKKYSDDPDRDVLEWVVVLQNNAWGYLAVLERQTHEQAQSYLTQVRDGKGIRLLDQRRAFRPGFVDQAFITPQVEWDAARAAEQETVRTT